MGTESIRVSGVVPANAGYVYEAWLDSSSHSAMTGGAATVVPRVGGKHTAWDNYIEGETVELEPGRRIVQTWRSQQFPAEADDSILEVLIEPEGEFARITFVHTDIPEGQGAMYEQGWQDHYLVPMRKYFAVERATAGSKRGAPAKKATSAKKAAVETAAKKAKKPAKKTSKPAKKAPKPAKKSKRPAKKAKKPAKKSKRPAKKVGRKRAKKAAKR